MRIGLRLLELHTAEPLLPGSSYLEAETAIEEVGEV
jgi:hypothetical protein